MSTAKRILQLSPEKREALNALLQRKATISTAIPRRNLTRSIPLSPGQQRLWFADQWQPGLAVYNLPAAVRLEGPVDGEVVRRTLRELLRRHEALRTTFRMNGNAPLQDIQPLGEPDFRIVPIVAGSAAEWRSEASRLATEESRRGFDLAQGPLFRCVLFTGGGDALALMTMHHIVADGWSLELLFREFSTIYGAYNQGQPSPLPEPALQYADFATWQCDSLAAARLESQWAYWEKQLASLPVLQLPTDRPRPASRSFAGSRADFVIRADTAARLREFNHHEGGTMNMTLLAAFCVLLCRYSGQDDIAIGCPVAGRSRPELERLIGFFVNTLVLRIDLTGRPYFRDCLARVKKTLLDALANQDIPFEQLVQRLQPERDLSRNPLFQVSFQLFAGSESGAVGSESGAVVVDRGGAMFDLAFNLWESLRGIEGRIEYSTDLFDGQSVAQMAASFQTLLESILDDADCRINKLPILSQEEKQQLAKFAFTSIHRGIDNRCIQQRVEAQSAEHPDRLAVASGTERITYGELNVRSNRLAHGLRAAGVGCGSLVAVSLGRTPDLIVALLGILKSGAAYVPIDPSYPAERIEYIREDARAAVTIIGPPQGWPCAADESNPTPTTTTQDLAYVIYTSGSTGLPKGVEIEHGSLMNLIDWHCERYAVSANDRASQVASISFDATVWEIWPYLASGAELYFADDEVREDPARMLTWLREKAITISFLPTPLAEEALRVPAARHLQLRFLLTGGGRLRVRPEPDLPFELVNHYGPTENTVVATCATVRPQTANGSEPPIGQPITNCRLYICDENMTPVPIGVTGEIYLGGVGVARGYHGRADLTANRFVADPFERGARLYRTGDIGRFLRDGNLEFAGRRDRQLKIRGFRIEPAEIETALLAAPGVKQAIVVGHEMPGGTALIAYVTGRLDREDLRQRLKSTLPVYMIPSAFVAVDAIPLTPNGKPDIDALPHPQKAETPQDAEPADALEHALAATWRDLLRVKHVGRHQDFFADFGGHSLLTVALVSRIGESLGIAISPRVIFEAPTIAQLARRLRGMPTRAYAKIERRSNLDRAPCSFAQRRLWFLDRLTPASHAYNIAAALRMDSPVDPKLLERALNQLARRHESLRTTFGAPDGEPMQLIGPKQEFFVRVVCVDGATDAEREQNATQLAAMEAARPFDLEHGPLLRVGLLRLGDRDHVLLMTMHHIISDGWSVEIFFRELALLYAAEVEGTPADLAELPIQFADYAVWESEWLSGERLRRQTEYWKSQLAGMPLLQMPSDRPRPAVSNYRGNRALLRLDAEVTAALNRLAQDEKATLFMTLLAAFETLIYRYSGQADFAIGTMTAGRGRTETEGLIGFFVNTLALRANLQNNPTFRELLGRVRESALEAYAHTELPFEKLVEELHPQRDLSRNPLVQVTFQLFNSQSPHRSVNASTTRELPVERTVATFDLALDMWESGAELLGRLEYSSDLFDPSTIERMLNAFTTVLHAVATDPDLRIDTIPLLTAVDLHRQLVEWNETARPYPRDLCVHQLFEAQAARSPQAVAVVSEQEELTYAELDARAERIARMLRDNGAGPEQVIGICMPRSPEWIATMLGVWKSGAAFLPIDPTYPPVLIETMLSGAGAILNLRAAGQIERLVRCMRGADAVSPANLAYVIYTSGSTGGRKAVAVEHAAIVNHAFAIIERFGLTTADRALQFASPGFDVALEEIFPTLLAGAALVLQPMNAAIAPRDLTMFMQERQITVANLPSPYWHEWAASEECGRVAESLRLLVIGSDRTDPRLVERWLKANGTTPRLLHAYGVTECVITSLIFEICEKSTELPVGQPLPNIKAYIFDRNLQPVPIGVIGELYIGGAGLARGYLGHSSDAFVSTHFGRLYRTGDRIRYLENGDIVFVGRRDHQIKLRGFRIEPSEIETALKNDHAVREAAVVLNDESLMVYVTASNGYSPESALAHLQGALPAYMLPHKIIRLEEMPRNSSGKTDLAQLKQLAAANGFVRPAAPTFAGDAEEKVAQIWRETLGIHSAGPDDNFFDLGGHSLALLRVHGKIEAAFGKPVPVIDLFRYPTVRSLAQSLANPAQTHS